VAMALRLWPKKWDRSNLPERPGGCFAQIRPVPFFLRHAGSLLAAMALVVGPWCVHQQIYQGRPSLTRSFGRQLWDATLSGLPSNNRLCPMPLEFADGPATARLHEALGGRKVNLRETFRVFDTLRDLGHSEIDADSLMQAVSLEAMRMQPLRLLQTRAYWCVLFWINEGETLHWQAGDAERGEFSDGQRLPPDDVCSHLGQNTWFSPTINAWHQAYMTCCWFPRRWVYGLAAIATLWGFTGLLANPRRRMVGVTLGLLFLYFTVTVALFAPPVYRYRMALEPLMIVVFVCALLDAIPTWRRALTRA
jgi:hypothetical protein